MSIISGQKESESVGKHVQIFKSNAYAIPNFIYIR